MISHPIVEAFGTMAEDVAEQAWAWAELRDARLGDARLTRRLVQVTHTLSKNPEESIPSAFGNDRHATKAVYRFMDNDSVDPDEILNAHRRATVRRIEAAETEMVLLVQDTTQFDFTKHRATEGLGPTGAPGLSGFFLHTALCLEPDGGVPLGLVDWHWWARDKGSGEQDKRKDRAIKDKESSRWLETLTRSTAALPPGIRTLTVADRESDIFEFFDHARSLGRHVLLRANHDRSVVVAGEAKHLWDAALAAESLGIVSFTVPRDKGRPERQAIASMHVATIEVRPPAHLASQRLAPVPLRAILLQEIDAPADQVPVQWLLLTTLPVATLEQAHQCVIWYTYRWRIERFHFVLKSGGNYERLQLQTADRLWRALAIYLVVAWRVLYIDLVARTRPTDPCTTFLTDDEWKVLCCHRLKTDVPPPQPPDVRTAVRWIAMLGGFLGRKGDGEPGVKTLWRGFRRLQDLVEIWQILHPPE